VIVQRSPEVVQQLRNTIAQLHARFSLGATEWPANRGNTLAYRCSTRSCAGRTFWLDRSFDDDFAPTKPLSNMLAVDSAVLLEIATSTTILDAKCASAIPERAFDLLDRVTALRHPQRRSIVQ
jgi:hypothetical protein